MDQSYSMARRIWRILYPPLVFIAIQFFAMGMVGVVISMYSVVEGTVTGSAAFDIEAILEEVVRFATERSMLILLISNVINLLVFLPIWVRTRKHNDPYRNDRPVLLCLLVVGLFTAFNIIQMMLFALTDVMKFFPSYEEVADIFVSDSFLIQVLSIGVAAPVVEELIYRGILISRMKWLPAWAAVLVQAVIFGAVHMNVFQGLYAFVAGILLGLVYVKFRLLVVTIIGHMAYNLASVFLGEFASDAAAGAVVVLSIVVLPVCAVLLLKQNKARKLLTEHDLLPSPVYAPPADPWTTYTSMNTWNRDE